ncbi:MAG: hypothetical protein KAT46_05625 [Deltaproteobacteria bacterium]|nr:hypothetical protein [Deltaproteobacteria bacterium]
MKKYFLIVLIVVSSFIFSPHQSFGSDDNSPRIGIAIGSGVPFGGLGGYVSYEPLKYFSASLGAGVNRAGLGWAVGSRFYFNDRDKLVRPRVSVFYGVLGTLEDQNGDLKPLEGYSYGPGVLYWIAEDLTLEFDVLFLDYNLPSGYMDEGSKTVVSIGVGLHF